MSMWGGFGGQRHKRLAARLEETQPPQPPGTCGQRPTALSTARCELPSGHTDPRHQGRTARGYRKQWQDEQHHD